jgi:hypothetical protein
LFESQKNTSRESPELVCDAKAPHEKVRLASKPRIEHGPERIAVTILSLQEYHKHWPFHTYKQNKGKRQYLAKQAGHTITNTAIVSFRIETHREKKG